MPWRAMPLAPVATAFAAGVGLAPWARPDVAWTTWLAALASTGALLLKGRTAGATALLLVGVAAVGALHGIEAPLPPGHVARLAPAGRAARGAPAGRRPGPGGARARRWGRPPGGGHGPPRPCWQGSCWARGPPCPPSSARASAPPASLPSSRCPASPS